MPKNSSDDFVSSLILIGATSLITYAIATGERHAKRGPDAPPRTPGELIGRLRAIVSDHHASPVFRTIVRLIRQEVGDDPFDRLLRIDSIGRKKIRNHPDPGGRPDYFASPRETLSSLAGDCDDKAIFMATLLEADGFQTALLYVPKHVLACVQVDRGILARHGERFGPRPSSATPPMAESGFRWRS
jgi:hypothetical protein